MPKHVPCLLKCITQFRDFIKKKKTTFLLAWDNNVQQETFAGRCSYDDTDSSFSITYMGLKSGS